ncbi:hypothetical protein AX15_002210 [Amanita polypyramis BW_CC]|nr:hypothetical protein AX15_002210 [Amanita polypyramis BW_CC]
MLSDDAQVQPSTPTAEDTSSRFNNWSLIEGLSRFGSETNSTHSQRSFFQGTKVHRRVDEVREAIIWIRAHWRTDYPKFMNELQESFLSSAPDFSKNTIISRLKKEWADRKIDGTNSVHNRDGDESADTGEDYTFLKLYTSEKGYRQIFSVLNNAFRIDTLSDEEVRLRAAVFLVELLTIELFNYAFPRTVDSSLRWDHSRGFTGTVYRGMCLSPDHLQDFLGLMDKPIKERYWSIPLAFLSHTTSQELALKFANESAAEDQTSHRVLFKTRISSLDSDSLKLYAKHFPTSVVTPICAVDISALSMYPEEKEIVLRGPFFQLVSARREMTAEGEELHVFDSVVFNTNRDHPSTMELSAEDGEKARSLFACLIEIARAGECMKMAREYGIAHDVDAYKSLHNEAQKKLARLLDDL